MCIKPPFPRQVLKDVMLLYNPGLERVSGRPIGLILLRCGMFPGEDKSRSCNCMRWYGDVWENGCSDDKEMNGLPMGASKEGELHLVMDENVSKPMHAFYILYFIDFSFKRLVGGYYPGVVTIGGNVTHKHFMEMRRLDRYETPFLLSMPPRSTTLAW